MFCGSIKKFDFYWNLAPRRQKFLMDGSGFLQGPDAFSFAEVSNEFDMDNIPPASVIKQLAVVVE